MKSRKLLKSPGKRAAAARPGKYVLRLFVAGASTKSREAVRHIRQLCEGPLKNNCELEVIDIYQQPKLARENQIVATPTLIKGAPLPVRRFIGNLINVSGFFVEIAPFPPGKIAF
jgi:circadian clock protein KaiB